jgi:sRNA-binding carbon storage regulator CsrA
MLVLTRKAGQSLVIAPAPDLDPSMTVGELFAEGPIEIIVLVLQGSDVRLGVKANKRLRILREEITPR